MNARRSSTVVVARTPFRRRNHFSRMWVDPKTQGRYQNAYRIILFLFCTDLDIAYFHVYIMYIGTYLNIPYTWRCNRVTEI